MKNIKPGLYKHFKNNNYLIITTVVDTENEEAFVLYTAESDNKCRLWIRPIEMFYEEVETNHGTMPRFAYVRDFNQNERQMLKQQLFEQ